MDKETKQKKEIISVSQEVKQPPIKTEAFEIEGWKFTFQKGGILPSHDLDELADRIKLQGIPDIVYGFSFAKLTNEKKNFSFDIIPEDSLSFVNFEKRTAKYQQDYDKSDDTEVINVLPEELKIKQAEHWVNKKVAEDADIKTLEKISDWSYTTPYKGTVVNLQPKTNTDEKSKDLTEDLEKLNLSDKKKSYVQKTNDSIPLDNLTPKNPIKWFNEFILFEDELGDCGLTQSSFRFRTMGDCFFGLLRFYLRVDEVIVRIYDTRIYHDFKEDHIKREFSVRENTVAELKKKGFKFTADFITDHRQSDIIYPELDVKLTVKDKVFF